MNTTHNDLVRATIAPILERRAQEHGLNVKVDVQFMYDDRVTMYHARIVLLDRLFAAGIENLETFMHSLTCNEYEEIVIDDRNYFIGDGDDTGAAWIEGGAVITWVRWFGDFASDQE